LRCQSTLAVASAAPPRIETIDVNVSVFDSYFTQRCGFEVRFFNIGIFKASLFVDETGTIVREIDTFPGDTGGRLSPVSNRLDVENNLDNERYVLGERFTFHR
jgi:hypothetical protein